MKTNQTKNAALKSRINFYLLMSAGLLFFLPLLSVLYIHFSENEIVNIGLIGKWFIFWAIGIRLFTAGIKQALDPAFTGTNIFKFTSKESYVVIRELGFANIALGVMGILSLINNDWRMMAAICGGLFFGLAALMHSIKKPDSKNEWIALLYDYAVFLMMLIYLAFIFIY
ncbi:MAG TPA: DUF6790 family protein [Parafilimonas sp.]|nr:DUF6790 family protein [Parafilimonas sp.]